jgi:hypothetical protein
MVHVPFRGATAAIPDVLAGRVQVFIGAINSLLPLIREGKLARARVGRRIPHRRVAGRTDHGRGGLRRRRSRLGGGTGGTGWHTASRYLGAASRDRRHHPTPGLKECMAAIGVDTVGTTPQDYAMIIHEEYAKWGKVVEAAGIKPE